MICGVIVSTTLLQHQEVSSVAEWLLHGGPATAGSWEGQTGDLYLLLRCEHAPYCQRGGTRGAGGHQRSCCQPCEARQLVEEVQTSVEDAEGQCVMWVG